MKKILIVFGVLLMVLSFCSCSLGNDTSESKVKNDTNKSEVKEDTPDILKIGERITTSDVEFVLQSYEFASSLSLEADDWLKPHYRSRGLSSGDGIYVWISFSAKNISEKEMSIFDFNDISIVYDGKYKYSDGVYTDGDNKSCTREKISSNNSFDIMRALDEEEFYGYITCSANIRNDSSNPLTLTVKLPNKGSYEEYTYELKAAEDIYVGDEVTEISEKFTSVLKDLTFMSEYVQNIEYSKWGQEPIDNVQTGLDDIDIEKIQDILPETAEVLPNLRNELDNIADMMNIMNSSTSHEYVEDVRSSCDNCIEIMINLMNTELIGARK